MNTQPLSPASSADEHTLRLAKLAAVTPVLLEALGDPSGRGPLLDLGCGVGEPALTAARRWPAVVGVDQDGQALETARERAHAQGLDNVEFRQGSFEHLGLGSCDPARLPARPRAVRVQTTDPHRFSPTFAELREQWRRRELNPRPRLRERWSLRA